MKNCNETAIKEDARSRIIQHATRKFLTVGIKDVKMDDIAKELGISKRTIYENFEDKKELLFNCLKATHEYINKISRPYLRVAEHSTLDKILFLYNIYFEMLSKINKKFFIELNKYPEVINSKKQKEVLHGRIFKAWIKQAVKEGLIREDVKFDVLHYILQRDIELLSTTNEFPNYTAKELGQSFILFYLRGICTEKGQVIIERFIQDNKNNK